MGPEGYVLPPDTDWEMLQHKSNGRCYYERRVNGVWVSQRDMPRDYLYVKPKPIVLHNAIKACAVGFAEHKSDATKICEDGGMEDLLQFDKDWQPDGLQVSE